MTEERPLFGPYVVQETRGGPAYLIVSEGAEQVPITDDDALRLADQLLRVLSGNREARRLAMSQ